MVAAARVVSAFSVDGVLIHGLATVCTDQVVLLEFICILVNQLSPLIHLLSRLLIELFLVTVVTLLQFLAHLVNSIVLLLAEHPQSIVVFIQQFTFSQLSWQVTRVNIDVDLKPFCDRILDVLVQLSEVLEECYLIVAVSYLLHKHQDLIDTSQVPLDLSDVMLEDGVFHTLS